MVQQRIESKFNSTEKIPRQNPKKRCDRLWQIKGELLLDFLLLRWNDKML